MKSLYWMLWLALGGTIAPAQSTLTIEVDNYVPYHDDVADPATFASTPNIAAGTGRVFQRFVFIGDIVAVNGQPAKGIWTAVATNVFLTPTPAAKQGIADAVRQNIIEMYFDLQQADLTPVGTIMATGLTRGAPPPGAPRIQTGDSMAIVGGTGSFLGLRGQAGVVDLGSPRQASMIEDPASRRINGGAQRSYVLHLIPETVPSIAMAPHGPAVWHGDFSPVTAENPAKAGEVLILKAAGLGPTRPGVDPGQPFPPDAPQDVNAPVDVTMNGHAAEVINKIGWPGLADMYRVDVRVPEGTAAGTAVLQLSAAWIAGAPVNIPIH